MKKFVIVFILLASFTIAAEQIYPKNYTTFICYNNEGEYEFIIQSCDYKKNECMINFFPSNKQIKAESFLWDRKKSKLSLFYTARFNKPSLITIYPYQSGKKGKMPFVQTGPSENAPYTDKFGDRRIITLTFEGYCIPKK